MAAKLKLEFNYQSRLLLALVVFSTHLGFAQKLEGANWYFGQRKSLLFRSGQVFFDPLSAATSTSSSFTLSDSTSKLLIYSSGAYLYNGQHLPFASYNAFRSCLAFPVNDSVVGIFSTFGDQSSINYLPWFTLINYQKPNSASAKVFEKQLLNRFVAQPLAIAARKDSAGYFLINRLDLTDSFYVWKTGTGISLHSVQKIGPTYNFGVNKNQHEVAKMSPNNKYLYTNRSHSRNYIDIYSFNDTTGAFSNWIELDLGHIPFAPSASPDSRYLYYAGLKRYRTSSERVYNIYRLDLSTLSAQAILNSRVLIDSVAKGNILTSQLAIDGNIYWLEMNASAYSHEVSRLTCPNGPLNQTRFQSNFISFPRGSANAVGLPTLNQTLFVNANNLQITPTKRRLCIGDTSILQAYGATADVFAWSGPPGLDSVNRASPRFIATAPGFYTFTVTGTSACTTASASVTIEVLPQVPPFSLGPDTALCPGQAFFPGPEALPRLSYIWNTGATTSRINATQPGKYWLTVTNGLCSVTDTVVVSGRGQTRPVDPWLLSGNLVSCRGDSVQLSAARNAYSQWLWSNGATTPSLWVRQTGWYKVRIARNDSCLSPWSDSIFVLFQDAPQVSRIAGPLRVCPGQQGLRYRLAAGGDSIIWQVTGGTLVAANDFEATINWGASGTGNIRIIAVSRGPCPSDTGDFPIVINGVLTPLAPDGPALVCNKAQAQLYEVPLPDQQPGSSYVWSVTNGSLLNAQGTQAWVRWNGPGTVGFTQTIATDSVCTGASATLAVEVLEPISLAWPRNLCQGDSVRATATSASPWNWVWQLGAENASGSPAALVAADSGQQQLRLTYFYGGCGRDTLLPITVIPRPEPVLLAGPTAVCPHDWGQSAYTFSGKGRSRWRYEIMGGSLLFQQDSQVWIGWNRTPPHQITVVQTSAQGCESRPLTIPISLIAEQDAIAADCDPAAYALSIPNIITPNGDGLNDRLEIGNLHYYGACPLTLTNRWGQTVYNTAAYANNFAGDDLPAAVYFYQLSAGGRVYKGWLQVIK